MRRGDWTVGHDCVVVDDVWSCRLKQVTSVGWQCVTVADGSRYSVYTGAQRGGRDRAYPIHKAPTGSLLAIAKRGAP